MPVYDLLCPQCGVQRIDVYQPITCEQPLCSSCDTRMQRAWLTKPANVIGDEIDIYIRHGLCEADGTPRRFRSKAEILRVAKEKGWTNYVEHIGLDGTDKNPHTISWATPPDLESMKQLVERVHG